MPKSKNNRKKPSAEQRKRNRLKHGIYQYPSNHTSQPTAQPTFQPTFQELMDAGAFTNPRA